MGAGSDSRLAELVARCEADRGGVAEVRAEGDALAADGSDAALARRWYVVVIRSVMADPPDGDAVRELYGELVDRYREAPPEHLAALRELGDEIRTLESAGALPKALVARSDRRRR